MGLNGSDASENGVVHVSARDWTQIHGENPGDGLTTVYLAAADNPYDIAIQNTLFEEFYQYWYVWLTPSGIDQNDTLTTEIYGTFGTGEGDDLITMAVNPPALQTQFLGSYVLAGPGNDTITTPDPIDDNTLNAYGGSGDDSITGTWNNDALYGDQVDYFYLWPTINGFTPVAYDTVGDGNDTIDGLIGNDTLVGGGGDDILSGGQDDDLISASAGNNQLFGGDGSDTITGGTGSDFLYGGPRGTGYLDILSGGGGADVFMLSYTEGSNDGSGFWGQYFAANVSTVTGDAVENGLSDIFKDGLEGVSAGFISAALGGIGQVLVQGFLSWIESLGPVETPKEDVLVIRDFDPSQDVLVLPTPQGVDLSEPSAVPFNPDAAGDYRTGLQFFDNNTSKLYAEVTLSTEFLASVGLTQDDTDEITRILNFVAANPTRIDAATGGFSSLSNLSAYLADGGFSAPAGAHLATDLSVVMFGAIGGLVYHSNPGEYANSFIIGTQYADVLTLNPVIQDPTTLTNTAEDFTTTQSEVHGLGGDDIIFGSNASDVLRGGDGNDLLYSFLPDEVGEDLSGGAGDDTIFGGGSFGTFDGGDGSDTFGVFYGQVLAPMQLFVDLTTGQAGERAAPVDTTAPVGNAPPFTPAASNTYVLTGFENVIGGSLNDWIRMTAGGTVEGGAGADYIDATAGSVTFSYDGSASGVSVQLYTSGPVVSGGDAQGDVLDYTGAYPLGVIGSDNADTLGGVSSGVFTFTGGGGADLFQPLAIETSPQSVQYTITDFSEADGDLIDLRLIGATADRVSFNIGYVEITDPANTTNVIVVYLPNFDGQVSAANVLLASAVTGRGRASAEGSGLSGGSGDDVLQGQQHSDYLFGNAGKDVIVGFGGADILDGGAGDDYLRGDDGHDRLLGGTGADTILGGAGDDTMFGGTGHDSIWGGAGKDRIQAGSGNDWLLGGDDADLIGGGAGHDSLWGGAGDDRLVAGDGNDWVVGGEGNDVAIGGTGQDSLFGGTGDDRLWGDAGDDLIFGADGADWLIGGAGKDTLNGGAGRDILDGGDGADVMRGGADADTFRLTFGSTDGDAILDFNAADGDRLVLRGANPIGITDLGGGAFSFTDGVMVETVQVTGATASDFQLLIG